MTKESEATKRWNEKNPHKVVEYKEKFKYSNLSEEQKVARQASQQSYIERYPDRRKATSKRYKLKNKERLWEINVWRSARARSQKDGLPFTIEISDIIVPTFCPVLGIPISKSGPREQRPSVDKIIPEKGYVKDNICVISMRANRIKSDASLDDLKKLVAYVENHLQGDDK